MHPLLAIGLLLTAIGVFADAFRTNPPGTKTITIKPKKKPAEETKEKPAPGSPGASDSEE